MKNTLTPNLAQANLLESALLALGLAVSSEQALELLTKAMGIAPAAAEPEVPSKPSAVPDANPVPAWTAADGPMTDEQYLQDSGKCPNCGSHDISGGPVDIDGPSASQEVTCDECDAAWNDLYALVGYSDLEVSA